MDILFVRSRWFAVLLVLALLAAGCAAPAAPGAPAADTAGGDTSSESAQPAASDAPVTIVHWQHHFETRSAIVQELAAEFEASHPNVKIDFQSIPYNDYFQKIGPSLEAGTGPDVFQIPGSLVREFYARNQLMPVPETIYNAADIEEQFVPWTVELLNQEGKYVGLPTDVQSFVLFYNDDLFREAGLDPTKDFASWEELEVAAQALTKRDGDQMTQAGINLTYSPYQWYWWLLSTLSDQGVVDDVTGQVTYNNEAGYDAWSRLTGLVTDLGVDNSEFLTGQNKFLLGKAGMDMHEFVFAGNLAASAPDMNYSIHMPPPLPGRPVSTVGTHWAYVVSAQSEHPDLAWEWIKFLTSAESQRKWTAGGGELPSLTVLYSDETLRADPMIADVLAMMDRTVPFDDLGWDDVYTIQQAIWDKVVLEGADVKTAVEEAAAAAEDLYTEKGLAPTR